MHYGHPDVFDRVFHITRGGISKASRVVNISEDIYAGLTYYFQIGVDLMLFYFFPFFFSGAIYLMLSADLFRMANVS